MKKLATRKTRSEHLFKVITSQRFLTKTGLGNEVHYFWGMARSFDISDRGLTERIKAGYRELPLIACRGNRPCAAIGGMTQINGAACIAQIGIAAIAIGAAHRLVQDLREAAHLAMLDAQAAAITRA